MSTKKNPTTTIYSELLEIGERLRKLQVRLAYGSDADETLAALVADAKRTVFAAQRAKEA